MIIATVQIESFSISTELPQTIPWQSQPPTPISQAYSLITLSSIEGTVQDAVL